MHSLRHHRFTLQQYLELDLHAEGKFEYCDGAILAMAGGSLRHNVVAGNVLAALHSRLSGQCRAIGSDQRVATGDGLHTYPDALVVCGEPELSKFQGTDTLHNPTLLVEVLSPSTREYDLGEKTEHYQTIPSLRDILLVEPDHPDVRHLRRTAEGWETRRFTEGEVDLLWGPVRLPVAEIYR